MVGSLFINQTGTIGIIFNAATQNVTGSEFLTLLGLIIIFILFFLMFGVPIEATAILILPMLIIYTAYSHDILSFAGLIFIYLGIIVAKNWLIQ